MAKPQRFANLAMIAEFSPPGGVPVLVDDDTVIYDSLAIMEYANDLGGGQSQSQGPNLAGELSLADLCFVPSVLRLTAHIPSLEPWPLSGAWTTALLGRPAVKEWLAAAHTLPPVRLDGYRDQRV